MSVDKARQVGEDRVLVRRIYIENFKSVKKLELELSPGLNVLVGPNASGKTNVLEAIDFLRRALIDYAGRIPYAPHIPKYWSGKDLIYGRDPSREVVIGFSLEHYHIVEGEERRVYRQVIDFKTHFRLNPQLDTLVPFKYYVEIGPDLTIMEISSNSIRVETKAEIAEKVLLKVREAKEGEPKRRVLPRRPLELMKNFESMYVRSGDCYVYEAKARFPEPLLFFRTFHFLITECVFEQFEGICVTEVLIPSKTPPNIIPILSGYYEKCEEASTVPGLRLKVPPPILTFGELVRGALEGATFIRHPDIGALTEPKPYQGELRLDERAANLASVLLALQGARGGIPESISDALAKLFPGLFIRIDSHMGRVVLTAEENGLELPPPNIPDGAVKLLAIMTAAELKPSVLLIDEIENSMHAKMLEYIVDKLNSLSIPVIVATHSPIVVDLVEPRRILIVLRDSDRGTYVERVKEPEELYEELKRLGIALSDYMFYGPTYRES